MRWAPALLALTACGPTLFIPFYSAETVTAAHPSLKNAIVPAREYKAPKPEPEKIEWVRDPERVLRARDFLRIHFGNDSSLNREIMVDPEGYIELPHAGRIIARDRTVKRLTIRIHAGMAHMFREPDVTIHVRKKPTGSADIVGRVRNPGRFEFENPPWLRGAITRGGGFAPRANIAQVLVVRRDIIIACNLYDASDAEENITARDGDVIVVTELYTDPRSCAREWGPIADFIAGRVDRDGLLQALKP